MLSENGAKEGARCRPSRRAVLRPRSSGRGRIGGSCGWATNANLVLRSRRFSAGVSKDGRRLLQDGAGHRGGHGSSPMDYVWHTMDARIRCCRASMGNTLRHHAFAHRFRSWMPNCGERRPWAPSHAGRHGSARPSPAAILRDACARGARMLLRMRAEGVLAQASHAFRPRPEERATRASRRTATGKVFACGRP